MTPNSETPRAEPARPQPDDEQTAPTSAASSNPSVHAASSSTQQRSLLARWWSDAEIRMVMMSVMFAVLGGAAMGVAWAAITPSGLAYAQPGYWYAVTDAELIARQQFVFGALGAAIGVVHGLWAAWNLGDRPVTMVLWMAFSGYAGSALAWLVGHLIGPLRPVAPLADHPQAMVAPLEIQAYGVLLFWPAAACLSMTVVLVGLVAFSVSRGMRVPATHQ